MSSIRYRRTEVDGFKIFYREAGHAGAPKLLLLHGFPSAGHMFREPIRSLSTGFVIAAPTFPGSVNPICRREKSSITHSTTWLG